MKIQPPQEGIFNKRWKLPASDKMSEAVSAFSPTERIIFFVFVAIFLVSAISLLWKVDNAFLVTVPREGGTLQEGVIGSPRFINPLLAISDADKDLSALAYSGLMKRTVGGKLEPDLAATYDISPDGLIYTFTLRNDIYFHDGKRVTADDVAFTIEKAQDPALKSPKFVNWEGVNVSTPDESHIVFILKKPYAPFLENTTLGILPKHIWQNISSDEFPFSNYNIEPIGSGPYKIKGLKRDSGGIPVYYRFTPFGRYALGKPYISNLIIKFYKNESELLGEYKNGDIAGIHGISAENASALGPSGTIQTANLPRVFAIFLNQNQASIFTDKNVRIALDLALDKETIVQGVLKGFGTPLDGPLPERMTGTTSTEVRIEQAKALLAKAGWKTGSDGVLTKGSSTSAERLAFSISTSDAPELKAAADTAAAQWKNIGADVSVHVYELGDLNQNVIRARKYEALLFGEALGTDLDLYPFWHSSQRNDPGLNIAEYTNSKVDKLLESARETTDETERQNNIAEVTAAIREDTPAIFLYSPKFIYVLPTSVKGAHFVSISSPEDRFNSITDWYIETNKVWSVFADQK